MSGGFRLGIVGSGKITADSHLPAAIRCPLIEVSALVDPEVERAAALARSAGIQARIAAAAREILDDVDGVLIATPNHTHAEIAIECINSGIPVLIEKPVSTTLESGQAIATAAAATNTTVAVGFCTRFTEKTALVSRLLETSYLGKIRSFDYQFGVIGGWESASGFTLDGEATGGGVLVTTGTHFLERVIHWFGYPQGCELEDDAAGGPEANAVASFRYGSFGGSARFSKTVRLTPGLVIESERGTLIVRDGEPDVRFRSAEFPQVESILSNAAGPILPTDRDMFVLQLEDFVSACREARPPAVTLERGLEVVQLVEELYAARKPMKTDWYDDVR